MKSKEKIDEFKDYMFKNRSALGIEKVNEMENQFIEMVRQYKIDNPSDFKNIKRWRNWYKSVKKKLHTQLIPSNEIANLVYHLESFRVMDAEKAVQKVNNWLNRMEANGYEINEDLKNEINGRLNIYGYYLN